MSNKEEYYDGHLRSDLSIGYYRYYPRSDPYSERLRRDGTPSNFVRSETLPPAPDPAIEYRRNTRTGKVYRIFGIYQVGENIGESLRAGSDRMLLVEVENGGIVSKMLFMETTLSGQDWETGTLEQFARYPIPEKG